MNDTMGTGLIECGPTTERDGWRTMLEGDARGGVKEGGADGRGLVGRRSLTKGGQIAVGLELWQLVFVNDNDQWRAKFDVGLDDILVERLTELGEALLESRKDNEIVPKKLAASAVVDLKRLDLLLDWLEAQGSVSILASDGLLLERRRWVVGRLFNINQSLIQHGLRNRLEGVRGLALKANERHWRFFAAANLGALFGPPWVTSSWRMRADTASEVMTVLMDGEGLEEHEKNRMGVAVQRSLQRDRLPGEMITSLPPWMANGADGEGDGRWKGKLLLLAV